MMKHIACFLALCAVALANNTTERVKGGNYASPGEFPYQASVWHNGQHICGGALITIRHVATSASCLLHILRDPKQAVNVEVLVGTIDLTRDGILYKVSKFVPHPDYNWRQQWTSHENDIGVLHLMDPVQVSRFVKQANLPSVPELPPNVDLVFTGWGGARPNGPAVRYLQKAKLQYISPAEFQRYYPNTRINSWQICTAPNNYVGACSTDIGGPLVSGQALVGISTSKLGCGSGLPDVFTKVSYYEKFLLAEIASS